MSAMFWQLIVSADGFIAGPNGEFDWHIVDEDFTRYVAGMLGGTGAILLGRATYDGLSQYWPSATEPEAGRMNELRKVVVSRSLKSPAWHNTTVADGRDLAGTVAELKASAPGRVALFGSPSLAAQCLELGLLDEVHLMICPVLLGAGTPVGLALTRRHRLRLVGQETLRSGMLVLRYAPER